MSTNHSNNVSIEVISENGLLLCWPEVIEAQQHQHIVNCQQLIKQQLHLYVIETLTSYNSIMVYYHFDKIKTHELIYRLQQCIQSLTSNKADTESPKLASNTIEIPVYYGLDAGWDLNNLAAASSLSVNRIIQLHSQQSYRAYALGFTPGFCYLADVNEQLHFPRKQKPRKQVPKGAVAIAEQQTAVYPNESPGGWHIIGQTPLAMYSINNGIFTPRINVGDTVVFTPIDHQQFIQLGGIVHNE